MKTQNKEFNVVTGAFGFTGKHITKLLLEEGIEVRTLTNHPERKDPFNGQVKAMPFNFNDMAALVESLQGATTVYNTYWVRFNYGRTTYGRAVANVQNLIRAASIAGVKRFVHVSIAHPDKDSTSGYYKGKAQMEETLKNSGMSYAIVRPTVLFGEGEILFNNIAWILRYFPVFSVPGIGDYRIQPVSAKDLAALAVELAKSKENIICDAVGPETFTFEEIVYMLRTCVKSRSIIMRVPPTIAHIFTSLLNPFVGDVVLTRQEIKKLMGDKLVSYEAPRCKSLFSRWIKDNADNIGKKYVSELKVHFKQY